jgi:MFS family permease
MIERLRNRIAATSAERERIVAEYPHFRRNYRLGIANGVFFNCGLSFFSRTTIIPVFLAGLGAPSVLISLMSLSESLGWHLPQFFVSKLVVHRARKMPLYSRAGIVRFLGLATAVVSAWLAGRGTGAAALATFVLGFGTFAIASGFAGLVFMEILAKTCPASKRGTYFGWRSILSGIIGFGLGVGVIDPLFTHVHYAASYMIAFGIGAVLIGLSFVLFARQAEPLQSELPAKRTFRTQLANAGGILRTNRQFRVYVIFRCMMMLWFAGIPFYTLFARDRLGVRAGEIGLFISFDFAGGIIASFLWGYISNRIGNRALLIIVCTLGTLLSALLLLFHAGALPVWTFAAVYFISSAVDSGYGNGGVNYALEIVPEAERPTYIGLMNTLLACALVVAALLGGLRDLIGYGGLFATTGLMALIALVTIVRLPEPRRSIRPRRA